MSNFKTHPFVFLPKEAYCSFHLPKFQSAANETMENLKLNHRFVQYGALSVASVATQPLFKVFVPCGYVSPIGLFITNIGATGEGKSSMFAALARGLKRVQEVETAKHAIALRKYKEDQAVHAVVNQALSLAVRRAISDGGDVQAAEDALLAHIRSEPKPPTCARVHYDNITMESVFSYLASAFPCGGLMASEGMILLGGRAFSQLEILCDIWSSGSFSKDRATAESFHVVWCCLMIYLSIQRPQLDRWFSRHGEKSEGLGFWERMIVCEAESTQGQRFAYSDTMSWAHCDGFADRVEELLTKAIAVVGQDGYQPEVLEFTAEASSYWFTIYNRIEAAIQPGGRYQGAGGHASKLAENIARVAATLHAFEGFEGDISLETLRIAEIICDEASADYMRVFVRPSREIEDAKTLNDWFDTFRKRGQTTIPRNFARRNCPNKLRQEGRFYIALDVLRQQGVVSEYPDLKMAVHINLFPYGNNLVPYGVPPPPPLNITQLEYPPAN